MPNAAATGADTAEDLAVVLPVFAGFMASKRIPHAVRALRVPSALPPTATASCRMRRNPAAQGCGYPNLGYDMGITFQKSLGGTYLYQIAAALLVTHI